MTLSLKVRPVVGTSIEHAIRDGCRLAEKLELSYVEFKFNGRRVVARPDGRATVSGEGFSDQEWGHFGATVMTPEGDWETVEQWNNRRYSPNASPTKATTPAGGNGS